ncbi:hypothetical protein PV325_010315 [Microctonus aethiopoides]|uniref:Protein ECT2 n=1 Tax=Microctonus aethiopoides TaxID=144406 RepID=A0AA39FMY4_9HYME|nr:hypothetical protein PV325_010315 [Microctonus aethiopoides]KAK0172340.1 hypothetical protein PV328_005674 [Microctonus aethiopoides]
MEEQSVHSSISDINSEEPAKNEHILLPRKKRICLVGIASSDPALGTAAQQFGVPVLKSETGIEYVDDTAYCTYFILKHFDGPEYEILHKSAHRLLGPTALLQLADKKESLPSINRPMYTRAMLGTVVVFTGFRKKDELTRLINMIHSMGGSIRKEMGAKVTHLIANCCGGDKYRYAVTFRVPIMSMNWVVALWDAKDDIGSYGNNDNFIEPFKLKPFFGARVCFFGFPEDEKKHMCEVLQQQGGESTEIDDPECTHVVTDIGNNKYKITNIKYSIHSPIKYPYTSLFQSLNDSKCQLFIYYNLNTSAISSILDTNSYVQDNDYSYSRFNSLPSENISISSMPINKDTSAICSSVNNISYDSAIFMDYASLSSSEMSCLLSENFNTSNECFINVLTSTNDSKSSTNAMKRTNEVYTDYDCESVQLLQHTSIPNFDTPIIIQDNDNDYLQSRNSIKGALKKMMIPPRYVKWKKSKANFTLPKSRTSLNNSQFGKVSCHSDLSINRNHHVVNDCSLSSSVSSLLADINFPFTHKRSMKINSCKIDTSSENKYTQQCKLSGGLFRIPSKTRKTRHHSKHAKHFVTSTLASKVNTPKQKYFKSRKIVGYRPFRTVVDESNVNTLPDLASVRAYIVKAEWFWTSVQNEGAADEKEYLFEDYLESVLSPSVAARRDSQPAATPTTASTRRKRKRLAETLSSLVQNGGDSPAVHKRRSSISDAGHLSVSGSFLDCTASPDKQLLDDIPEVEAVNTESARKNLSPRHQVFLELVQTESNYVGILSTIMTLFKSPLEDYIETTNELLNSTEAKIIFGNFPPIYEVHKKMLEELRYSAAHWAEDTSIGNIFLKYAPDLVKAYPPYVNFFENTKEMLDQCDQNKPRFHAFLKICQTKPECGRQSLKELMIKPVQRLPSISLLLTDILKHTNKNNPDHSALELSISSIKEVMTYINEDKRKTEGQLVMFDIFNEIDNCPPHLVSSHRSFIGKCDVMELSEGLSGRGDHLVLFLFTDTLEICKKRSKAFNSLKSPNMANGLHTAKLSQGKPYKHIKMLSLSTIKKVVDIRETDECQKVFALMVRSNQELKEKLFSFTICDEEVNKTNYLRTLCRQMANTVCKADADTFLISLDSHQLEIDTSDVALGTLSKAFKFASRTRMKVGRAFSFNKTPSKLKRAMSTMMSPFGSTHSLTPASQQLAQMRLASCNNINELGNGGSDSPSRDDVLVAPMSVQPTRKAKCSSLSMASLRRL